MFSCMATILTKSLRVMQNIRDENEFMKIKLTKMKIFC
jgi:hypothetical protein